VTQQVNLVNPALRKKRDFLMANNVGLVVASLLVILLASFAYASVRADQLTEEARKIETQLNLEQAKLVEFSKQLAEQKPDAHLAADLANTQKLLASRKDVMTVLQSGVIGKTEGFSEYMRAFARQSINGLWLTSFLISSAENEMEMHGRTLSAELVPAYIGRLNSEKSFNGRSFAMLEMNSVAEPAPKPTAGVASGAAASASSDAAKTNEKKLLPYIEFSLRSIESVGPKP